MNAAPRVSPALDAFPEARFEHGAAHGMRVALAARAPVADGAFVAELSAIPKRIVVGAGARTMLASQGFETPAAMMRWRPLGADGAIVLLHRQRYLVVAPSAGADLERVQTLQPGRNGDALVLPYDAAEFAFAGEIAAALVREFCPLDLAATAEDAWLATRFAHCEVMLWRPRDDAFDYRLICTPADASFLISTLVVAGAQLAGYNDYLACLKGGLSS